MKAPWILPLLVFVLSLLLFLAGLARLDFLMIDTRFALFVHEMLENGATPFPQLYGRLYPDYTSIPTMLMALAALACGAVDMFSAVLPSAVAGALTVMMTFVLGRRLYSTRTGLAAALLLFAAYEWVSICRIVSLDLYPALATILVFYLLYSADADGKRLRLGWIPLLLVLGYLARGPIGTVIPTAVGVGYCLVRRQWLRGGAIAGFGAAIAGLMLALWTYWSYAWGGEGFYRLFLEMQFGNRFESAHPPWYYFTNAVGSFAATYPLAIAAVAAYLWQFRDRCLGWPAASPRLQRVQLLVVWVLVLLLGMSIPGTKHLRYITGAIPALALLASLVFFNPDHLRSITRLRRWLAPIASWMPAAGIVAMPVVWFILRLPAVAERLGAAPAIPVIPVTAAFLLLAAAVLAVRRRGPSVRILAAVMALGVSVYLIRVGIVEPVDQARLESRQFTEQVEALRPDGAAIRFFCLGPDGDEHTYRICVDRARRFIPVNLGVGNIEAAGADELLEETEGLNAQDALLPILGAAGLLLLGIAVWTVRRCGRSALPPMVLLAAVWLGAVCLVLVHVSEPLARARRSLGSLAGAVAERIPEGGVAVGPADSSREGYRLSIDRDQIFTLAPADEACDMASELDAQPAGTLIVTRRDRWERYASPELKARAEILAEGRISRRDCILLKLR